MQNSFSLPTFDLSLQLSSPPDKRKQLSSLSNIFVRYKLRNTEEEEEEEERNDEEEVGRASGGRGREIRISLGSSPLPGPEEGRKLQGQRLPFRDVSWLDGGRITYNLSFHLFHPRWWLLLLVNGRNFWAMYASHLHSQPLFHNCPLSLSRFPPSSSGEERFFLPSRRVIRNAFQKKREKVYFSRNRLKKPERERINDEIEKLREIYEEEEEEGPSWNYEVLVVWSFGNA